MRPRPVRSKIYLPVILFYVVSSDWKYVLAATLLGYLIPFFFDLKIWVIPMWLITGVGMLLGSIAFFSYIRNGRRPHWFEHTLRALWRHPRQRRVLPVDNLRQPRRAWLH
ncbi:MAG: hypothetical protein ACRD63_02005 [Pyrinomonadaceae bacterium]